MHAKTKSTYAFDTIIDDIFLGEKSIEPLQGRSFELCLVPSENIPEEFNYTIYMNLVASLFSVDSVVIV